MKMVWKSALRHSALVLALSGTVIGLAGFGFGHFGCHGQKFVKRIIDAHVEEALDKLEATADQRQKVSTLEDRLLGDVRALRQAHRAALAKLGDQFAQEQLDASTLDETFATSKQSVEQLRQDLRQTILDLHEILTPLQRQQLATLMKQRLQESSCSE